MEGGSGGWNANLVNSKSNCECYMVFGDSLFVSNTSYGSKIDEIKEHLKKKLHFKIFIWIKKNFKPGRAEHLDTCGR